jgi:hypothetical protein
MTWTLMALACAMFCFLVYTVASGRERPASTVAGAAIRSEPLRIEGPSLFAQPIVGESFYLKSFRAVFGNRSEDGVDVIRPVVVACQDDNPHDPMAVCVRLDGHLVGYLSRADVRKFRKSYGEQSVACDATIRGGWSRGPGDKGDYGVMLDLTIP